MKGRGIDICRRCHAYIHNKFPEKFLGRELNTLEKLAANETIQSYLKWARKQK